MDKSNLPRHVGVLLNRKIFCLQNFSIMDVNNTTTVLIVEPFDALRVLTRHILVNEGFQVIEAKDELSGFQCLIENKPKYVICSEYLPGLSGLQFYYRLNRLKGFSDFSFVLAVNSAFYYKNITSLDNIIPLVILERPFTVEELLKSLAGSENRIKKNEAFTAFPESM